jgi:UDP-galactopyranose mutase
LLVDFVVVGSGLTGAVIARTLAEAGQSVLVVERRSHLGGNVFDETHQSGVRIHKYGPHYFRTNSDKIWQFVNRFARFQPFEAVLKSYVDGRYENWPVAGSYIRRAVGQNWEPEPLEEPRNFEEASLAMMPRLVYDKFVRGYTEKQWGVPAASLAAGLAKRFDVRHDDEPRLMRHRYQGVPENGYATFMQELLKGIRVVLNCDYLLHKAELPARKMVVYTGPIDEYFGFCFGKLKYRGQRRQHEYLPDSDWAQPCVQVNNPDPANGPHIRSIEWKHIMAPEYARRIHGTVLTREITYTPGDPNDYEYPFPDDASSLLYSLYAQRAQAIPDLLVCGRLGEYRYYDMDQAIARAQVLAERIVAEQAGAPDQMAAGNSGDPAKRRQRATA